MARPLGPSTGHPVQVAGAAARHLQPGEAIRIGTGALTPAGSTAVVRDENIFATNISGIPAIEYHPGGALRDDTRQRGESWYPGTVLAPIGLRVSPTLVSVAASSESPVAEIRGPVRAHVILTGDEIRTRGPLKA